MNKEQIVAVATVLSSKVWLDMEVEGDEDVESEDELVTETAMILLLSAAQRTNQQRIENYIERTVALFTDVQFQQNFRMSRENFEVILRVVGPPLKKQRAYGRNVINPEKQILSVIWLLATPDSYRSVGERFDMPKSSLSKCFFKIIKMLCDFAPIVIKWPSAEERNQIKENFQQMGALEDVIGAVDGTYIVIKAPKEDAHAYVTRKCDYAITLQAICKPSLQFTDVFVGYPGSCHDNRIFRNSTIFKDIQANPDDFISDGEYILGDKAYPTLIWCIPPYINRGAMTEAQTYFNRQLAKTRQTIERAFALLFGRFRRLKFLDMSRTDLIPATVLAACVLHNICKRTDLDGEFITEGLRHLQQIQAGEEEVRDVVAEIVVAERNAGRRKRDNMCRDLFRRQLRQHVMRIA